MRIPVKWIVAVALLLVVAVAAVYLVIPATLLIRNVSSMSCNTNATGRAINANWQQLFAQYNDSSFTHKGYTYTFQKKLNNAASIVIKNKKETYATNLILIPVSPDSCMADWKTTVETGANPFEKLEAYNRAAALKENMSEVLQQLQLFVRKVNNVYGYNIQPTTLTDTVLVSTKRLSKTYPGTAEVYHIVHELQQYIGSKNAVETNSPMLNVTQTDSGFITMVAIPVNKELPASGSIYPKRLVPMKDKVLTADVTGGEAIVQHAYKQIELYMMDHSLRSPVIPFELMITDRSKEKDTTKWQTKIYYPII